MSRAKILFVVEGKDEHDELIRNIIKYLNLNIDDCNIITYKTSIHELYDLITNPNNEGISLPSLLISKGYVDVDVHYQMESTFSSIYLVFDFDPQHHKFNPDHLKYLANRFNNDGEEGLLLLNYPMFESLLDINDLNDFNSYLNKKINVITSDEYKSLVKSLTFNKTNKGRYLKHIDDKDKFIKVAEFNLLKYLKILNLHHYDGIKSDDLLSLQLTLLNNEKLYYVINTLAMLYFDYN